MFDQESHEKILKRIDSLGHEVGCLKRDFLHGLTTEPKGRRVKPTLFGSVRGGDVTEQMIEEAKQSLFRPLEDL